MGLGNAGLNRGAERKLADLISNIVIITTVGASTEIRPGKGR
jgi:hypothetical protein